jgi:signal transduction histidine kinase
MAAQLEERTAALESADRTRRQLLADVSHELTTPLASIRGYVETLAMADLQLNDETRWRYLSIVTDEAERLEHIIGDLLDLARLEGGGGSLKVEQVSLSYLLERVWHRHGPVVAERDIKLETIRDPVIDVIAGDSNRLEQVLQNLVANAVRHTPSGGRVAVTINRADAGVTITVDDSGPGIPVEHLPRIFDRFYKVDESRTGTTTPSGSGLGLSIVRAIVVRHGGTISAENRAEGGARFRVYLPVAAGLAGQESG